MTNEHVPATGPGSNTGHGYVWPRPDGAKSRCGGPKMCNTCRDDLIQHAIVPTSAAPYEGVLTDDPLKLGELLTRVRPRIEAVERTVNITVNNVTVVVTTGKESSLPVITVKTGHESAQRVRLTYLELATLESAVTAFMRDLGAR